MNTSETKNNANRTDAGEKEKIAEEIRQKVREWEDTLKPTIPRYYRYKWYVDVAVSVLTLPVIGSVILLFMLLTRLTSKGPIIYSQVRCSKNGKPFKMYKIRSMVVDAEAGTGAVWAGNQDPRITRIGKIMRKLHIDELPQIINVWRGEMTVIGPRPERPEFVEPFIEAREKIFRPEFEELFAAEGIAKKINQHLEFARQRQTGETMLPNKKQTIINGAIGKILHDYAPDYVAGYEHRLSVLPGMTGYAQINLPPDSDVRDVRKKLILDLDYINNAGLWFDFKILLGTACKFVRSKSLYQYLLRLCGICQDPKNSPLAEVIGIESFDETTLTPVPHLPKS
ncbi:MAG: sugar transferase [Planctomycetaceae bacterium]|nr:sugar transferase [Planctomycetaceae bacterium]